MDTYLWQTPPRFKFSTKAGEVMDELVRLAGCPAMLCAWIIDTLLEKAGCWGDRHEVYRVLSTSRENGGRGCQIVSAHEYGRLRPEGHPLSLEKILPATFGPEAREEWRRMQKATKVLSREARDKARRERREQRTGQAFGRRHGATPPPRRREPAPVREPTPAPRVSGVAARRARLIARVTGESLSTGQIAEELEVTGQTARNDVQALLAQGVLEEMPGTSPKRYRKARARVVGLRFFVE